MGDVNFTATPGQPARDLEGHSAVRGSRSLQFRRLPGTAAEIDGLRDLFRRTHPGQAVQELRGDGATESAFRAQARGKRYLHLATHGFFAGGVALHARSGNERRDRLRAGRGPGNPGGLASGSLLSGLALAGANQGLGPGDLQRRATTAS